MACVSSAATRAVALTGLALVLVVAMAMADGPPSARTTFPAPQMHGYRLANPKEVARFELSYGAVADHVIELTVVLTPAPYAITRHVCPLRWKRGWEGGEGWGVGGVWIVAAYRQMSNPFCAGLCVPFRNSR